MESFLKGIGDVLYGGIRPDIPGHGGEECAHYLPPYQLIGETLLTTAIMIFVGILAFRTYTMPKVFPKHEDLASKRILLIFLCIVYGIEIGFKIVNRSALYLLNPCHVTTVIEVCVFVHATFVRVCVCVCVCVCVQCVPIFILSFIHMYMYVQNIMLCTHVQCMKKLHYV